MPPLATLPTQSPSGVAFADVVLAIQDRVVSVVELPVERVLIVANRAGLKWSQYPAEKHVRIRPLGRKAVDNPGAGRLLAKKTRVVAIDLVTRSQIDPVAADALALTDESSGHLRFEDEVLDALDLHTPVGRDGAKLVIDPMRETTTDDPDKPQPADGFMMTTIYFEVDYAPRYLLSRT